SDRTVAETRTHRHSSEKGMLRCILLRRGDGAKHRYQRFPAPGSIRRAQIRAVAKEGGTGALRRRSRSSAIEGLVLETLVERRDVFAVAIEQQGRAAPVRAEHALGRLAPARMRHGGIDVRPEAVLVTLQLLPEANRLLIGEGELDDRLDRFEAVFPRQHE